MVQVHDAILRLHQPIVPRVVMAFTADAQLIALDTPPEATAVQLHAPCLLAIAEVILNLPFVVEERVDRVIE